MGSICYVKLKGHCFLKKKILFISALKGFPAIVTMT